MNATALRPVAPSRFRRSTSRRTVETLMGEIAELARERQRLRDTCAESGKLERNRVKIARTQWELSHALIERYLPSDLHSHAA